jgi:chemotaxis protein CheC
MISTFINALSGLADMNIDLSVPAFTVDMQGAIMAVPMAEYGGQSNYLMTIGGDFMCDQKRVPCRLLLSPDIRSLDFLMRKLGMTDGN